MKLPDKAIPNLSHEEFLAVCKIVPTVVVEVLVKNKDGILLGKRNTDPFRGLWHFTGGFLYYNEKVADAVKRIAKREIGIDVEIVKFLGAYEYINADPRGHMIALVHIARQVGGKIAPTPDNSDLQFFKEPPEDMISHQKKIFEEAMRE